MTAHDLTPRQQAMVELWERHMAAEFDTKDIDAVHHPGASRERVVLENRSAEMPRCCGLERRAQEQEPQ